MSSLTPTIISEGHYIVEESTSFSIHGDNIEVESSFGNETICIKCLTEEPGMTIRGNNITVSNFTFDIDFLDIPIDDKSYIGILCEGDNITFNNCLIRLRYKASANSTEGGFMGISIKGKNATLKSTLTEFCQTLPSGVIVRHLLRSDKTFQLYVDDFPIVTPKYLSYSE